MDCRPQRLSLLFGDTRPLSGGLQKISGHASRAATISLVLDRLIAVSTLSELVQPGLSQDRKEPSLSTATCSGTPRRGGGTKVGLLHQVLGFYAIASQYQCVTVQPIEMFDARSFLFTGRPGVLTGRSAFFRNRPMTNDQ